MSISDNTNSSQNNVDLIDLIKQIWKDKYYILFFVLLFLAFAIYQLNYATYTYDIYLKVTPSKQMSVSKNNSQLSGFASFIGISTPQTNTADDFELYKTLLKSRIVSNSLLLDKKFITEYFKGEENFTVPQVLLEKKYIITVDKSWRSSIKNIFGLPSHPKRVSLEDLVHERITKKISVSTDILSNITTIGLKSVNPDLGIKLLEKIHKIADDELKNRSLQRTSDYISFLDNQLLKTTKQDQRLSLISSLAEQQRSKMIASSNLSFAAELFGKPYQSNSPTEPRIRNIIIVYFSIGFFTGLFISIFKYFFKFKKS